ncbi:hypothetical protein EUGRSUZ_D02159 [Eucalyptus grandis]|uniref:Uncharacterized protein n=2 Tax=Eucalyptus grandis TaxID=71139 RepID=A0ACC3L6W5_EUCGR|nr:hypothetical protein EUGRSUZ_D02159 [Eucalyptus grandis]
MEISHFSHEHPLTLCTAEDAGEPCNGCSRPIFDLGYVCYDCGFLLHKKCAKLPRKAHHRLHPKHPLTLLFNSSETFQCNVCKKTGSGFAFRCCECQYVMDVDSGFVYHCDKFPCNSCCKPCSNDLYRCVTCNFNVHSTCLPFPRTVKHIHHCHSLILKDSTLEEDPSGILCATCKKKISPTARAYYCAECSYGVHLERVVSELAENSWLFREINVKGSGRWWGHAAFHKGTDKHCKQFQRVCFEEIFCVPRIDRRSVICVDCKK